MHFGSAVGEMIPARAEYINVKRRNTGVEQNVSSSYSVGERMKGDGGGYRSIRPSSVWSCLIWMSSPTEWGLLEDGKGFE